MGGRGKYIFHRFTIDRPGSAKTRASSWPRDIGVCSLAAANVRRVDALRPFGFPRLKDRVEKVGFSIFRMEWLYKVSNHRKAFPRQPVFLTRLLRGCHSFHSRNSGIQQLRFSRLVEKKTNFG